MATATRVQALYDVSFALRDGSLRASLCPPEGRLVARSLAEALAMAQRLREDELAYLLADCNEIRADLDALRDRVRAAEDALSQNREEIRRLRGLSFSAGKVR